LSKEEEILLKEALSKATTSRRMSNFSASINGEPVVFKSIDDLMNNQLCEVEENEDLVSYTGRRRKDLNIISGD
jgi:hypothetical protein